MANEKRLIDANKAEKAVTDIYCGTAGYRARERLWQAVEAIKECPTVDAVEVVHGRWIMGVDEADYDYGVCSVCGFAEREYFPCLSTPNYCPNCGAHMMDGGNDDA